MLNDSLRDRRIGGTSAPQSDYLAPAEGVVFSVLIGALAWAGVISFWWAVLHMVRP
ncbi:MAG TPA: hypothetical protein VMT66_00385 [Steroidobacteraceae bacterium]|nr:hypothetical protein [Steroidobacteraceae bacterium]